MTLDEHLMTFAARLRAVGSVKDATELEVSAAYLREVLTGDRLGDTFDAELAHDALVTIYEHAQDAARIIIANTVPPGPHL